MAARRSPEPALQSADHGAPRAAPSCLGTSPPRLRGRGRWGGGEAPLRQPGRGQNIPAGPPRRQAGGAAGGVTSVPVSAKAGPAETPVGARVPWIAEPSPSPRFPHVSETPPRPFPALELLLLPCCWGKSWTEGRRTPRIRAFLLLPGRHCLSKRGRIWAPLRLQGSIVDHLPALLDQNPLRVADHIEDPLCARHCLTPRPPPECG